MLSILSVKLDDSLSLMPFYVRPKFGQRFAYRPSQSFMAKGFIKRPKSINLALLTAKWQPSMAEIPTCDSKNSGIFSKYTKIIDFRTAMLLLLLSDLLIGW